MKTVKDAVAKSVATNSIVRISAIDDRRMVATLHEYLFVDCDDHVVNGFDHEYWGTTDEGQEWRVHVVFGKGEE